jgi:sugar phosphate isomerase/epimerase
MRFRHPGHPGHAVRLGYCLNVVPAGTPDGVREGLRRVAGGLRERVDPDAIAGPFGTGLWVPAAAADAIAGDLAELDALRDAVVGAGLDAFTFNAFPAGGFHEPGLKQRVFRPSWREAARREFTRDVASLALACRAGTGGHVSISTHAGGFAADLPDVDARVACAEGLLDAAHDLAELEVEGGPHVVLSLEPEPRSTSNDTGQLAAFHALVRDRAAHRADGDQLAAHIGTCLDTCHAAVEFEDAAEALRNATAHGAPLGKVQLTSALALPSPADDEAGRARLFAMDEPTYLHQVTGRGPDGLVRATDLPEVRAAFDAGDPAWRACDEWRCHFHVPLHRSRLDELATTRRTADDVLALLLADPATWGGLDQLHLEIETYTWSLLEGAAPSLLDGLAAEYEHVLARLSAAGWIASGDR